MKTLLLDADGVFVNFVKGYLDKIKQATGKVFTPDQITGFNIGKALNLTVGEIDAADALITPGFFRGLEPIQDAIPWIQRLNLITNIYIVTSAFGKLPTWAHEREQWIQDHLGLPKSRIISTSAKHLIKGDFFVDDRADNCFDWDQENSGTAVIWEQPWNKSFPWKGNRFNDWAKLEALIQYHV